ncbi:hypothetical protein BD324DRAFT_620292 [Kockovaella imperatae]|uniref:C2H2-type domain-containing protein n=1 Tax=Kockovaella imperatae TaxID=4999 RepID=A0A1Y1UJR2_9TREE|nr:hypothetical protein BD324DRAFT_620292 [Kockovaella imperatae]ORX38291.1 hypothetical protein BD324DRAFT_620292 [Kockovaella imperatae]
MLASNLSQWRSPPPIMETPLVEAASLPADSFLGSNLLSPKPFKHDVEFSSRGPLIPPCEHSHSDGEMHSHAFDLLSLSGPSPSSDTAVPSSVPATSVLSATRPTGITAALPPKPRRMSSSTTGVLGRGKLGLTGDSTHPPPNANGRPTLNHAATHSSSSRRPGSSSSTTPQLFDFTKTDRRPSHNGPRPVVHDRRSISNPLIAASLPNGSSLGSHVHNSSFKSALRAQALAQNGALRANAVEDGELDMTFDGEDEDDELGSLEDLDMDLDGEDLTPEEIKKLALGSGSGGVKGRRKGMVFKCENCGKEYRHPSCLIKHRWEHSPHWQEPTQVSMSKHQQVQLLEVSSGDIRSVPQISLNHLQAAAILAHLDPSQGRSLPTDKSLWPAILSPMLGETAQLRRPSVSGETASRDPSSVRSPQSTVPPLTPSSLRDVSNMQQPRKSSPGSDSTTSSDGYSQLRVNGIDHSRPVGINANAKANGHHNRPTSSLSSSIPGPGTPQSVGSLPNELAGLHFYPQGTPSSLAGSNAISPIPNRGGAPLSLKSRGGVGGGMFGPINTAMPSSSVRSGAMADDEEELSSEGRGDGSSPRGRGKSSSEEVEERRKNREGEEWGMAMEMEL